ncbi:heavy-metal-associated domain-containing protein [uncultured Flavobacterium sp.]|jgi:mercuric ion binding protein|uniref:heavy-metal-associated domain-containing protein n=1 Tax=uncultured Flavobacterium sp. TaxID=165435 RepID=UPI0030CA587B
MKKIILVLILSIIGIGAQAQEKTNNKNAEVVFKTSGNCDMCKKRIEKAAFSVKGVKNAEWLVDDQEIYLIIDENKCTKEDVAKAIAKAGHDNAMAKTSDETYDALHGCCQYKRTE